MKFNPQRSYTRDALNTQLFNKAKKGMHQKALEIGRQGNIVNSQGELCAVFNDMYTDLPFKGGDDNYEYDHIISSHVIHSKYKRYFSDNEIAEIINVPENIGVTSRNINRSKGKYEMSQLLKNEQKLATLGIDSEGKQRIFVRIAKAQAAIRWKAFEIFLRRIKIKLPKFPKNVFTLSLLPNRKIAGTAIIILLLLLLGIYIFKTAHTSRSIDTNTTVVPKSPTVETPSYSEVIGNKVAVNPNDSKPLTYHFTRNQSKLNSVTKKFLDSLVFTLISRNDFVIEVKGYTCDLGTSEYNDRLSEMRVRNVEKCLLDKGIDNQYIKTEWLGESLCTSKINQENQRSEYRKVDIYVKNR
jgi:outer membrane protein OmpA-like peptidoglycan-associated protein